MPDDAIEDMHQRLAEQIMSDERLLGVLPEEATRRVLDHALARLDAAAARAVSVEALEATAAAIRTAAWHIVEQAAAAPDPEEQVRALLAAAPGAEFETMTAPVPAAEIVPSAPQPEPRHVGDAELPGTGPAQAAEPHADEAVAGLRRAPPLPAQHARPSLWGRVRRIWRGLGRDDGC
jgi:hypothetical protein